MKRTLTILLLMICFSSTLLAQDDASDKTKKALAAAAKNGNGLKTQITVNGNVHAQAVLIPRVDARRIFGKEIADNYAVVEVNVGNKSPDAALIIHGIFIDYSQWPLSGSTSADIIAARSTDGYQASAFPNQVASEEYRVVRGQLLDAQTDTLRNRFMRWLTLAGNLAGAFTFSINEQGIVKGIAAATGVGIPGVATAWPDKIIDQLNRISDFGFQANKVVPKQGSEVIVCFFPIDRFLTPGFRKLFLKSPALFFAPGLMLADKTVEKDVAPIVTEMLPPGSDVQLQDLKQGLPCFTTIAHPKPNDPTYYPCLDYFALTKDSDGHLKFKVDTAGKLLNQKQFTVFMAIEFLASVSLNRVTITIDGVMSVDVNTIAARIDDVELQKVANCGDQKSECFWANVAAAGGVRTGIIQGSYGTGGTVVLAEQNDLAITDVKTISEDSTDQELHFSFKLTKPIPPQTKLHFTVSKPQTSSSTEKPKSLDSVPWEYLVDYATTPR